MNQRRNKNTGRSNNRPPRGEKPTGRNPKSGEGRTPKSGEGRSERPARGEKLHTDSKSYKSNKPYKSFKKARGKQAEDLVSSKDGSMRLNKMLATAGIASRREADELIKMGLVTVNGKVVTELGIKVMPTDDVRYNGTRIRAEKKVYILMNKPKGFITTVDDPKARKTVMDLFGGNVAERIYPVGRLDRATTGVLLFTNDGDLAKKLTHPSHGAKKIYHVVLDKAVTNGDIQKIASGEVELEDGKVPVDAISFIPEKAKTNVGLELHVGRNRIVRRLFEHLGYEVVKLDRVSFAGLTKKNLSRGQWRHLNQQELNNLKMLK